MSTLNYDLNANFETMFCFVLILIYITNEKTTVKTEIKNRGLILLN